MMIEVLLKSLHAIGLTPTPQEIVEMFWLASHMGEPTYQDAEQFSRKSTKPDDPTPGPSDSNLSGNLYQTEVLTRTSNTNDPYEITESTVNAYLYREGSNEKKDERPYSSLQLPAVLALPHARKLARGLSPLKRRIPSQNRLVLDEEATAQQSAESDCLQLVFQAASERWLDLTLLIDENPSMILWQQTIIEFQHLLAQLGAFRTIETWYFTAESANKRVRIYPSRNSLAIGSAVHYPKHLSTTQKKHLILVLSDCIGQGWYEGHIAHELNQLGKDKLVGLVQMLPEYLWGQTALGDAVFAYLQAHLPGTINSQMQIELLTRWQQSSGLPFHQIFGIAIPIMTLEEKSLASWSNLLRGKHLVHSPGVFLPLPLKMSNSTLSHTDLSQLEMSDAQSPDQLLERFYNQASPLAQELASYIAAMSKINLPLIRIVQQTMLPESGQAQLAEVLFSGLFTQTTPAGKPVHPGNIQFSLNERVRHLLIDRLWYESAFRVVEEVWNKIAAFVSRWNGKLITFKVFIDNPNVLDQANLVKDDTSFIQITARLLAQLGYADAAEILEKQINPPNDGQTKSDSHETPERFGSNNSSNEEVPFLHPISIGEQVEIRQSPRPIRLTYFQTPKEKRLSREHDLNRILAIIQHSITLPSANSPRLLFIEGDAGIGKSWLLGNLQERLTQMNPAWRVTTIFNAKKVVSNEPYANFVKLLNFCAGKTLVSIKNPRLVTIEDVFHCAELLEIELTQHSNKPLVLLYDEVERWVDIESEQQKNLEYLFRIVWRTLMRQFQLPCIIVCIGRRLPILRDVLLRRSLSQMNLSGFSNNDLIKLIPSQFDTPLITYILDRAKGNPWITQLLIQEIQNHRDILTDDKVREQVLKRVFIWLLDKRIASPQLSDTLFSLTLYRPEGFLSDDPLLPDRDNTLIQLIQTSFVNFDVDAKRYHVAPVLSSLLHEPSKMRTESEVLKHIREILSDLFDNASIIRMLVDDTQIGHIRINFQGSANLIWHHVIDEARKQERLTLLLREAQKIYPENQALKTAIEEYQQLINAKPNAKLNNENEPVTNDRETQKDKFTTIIHADVYIAGDVNTGRDFVGRDKTESLLEGSNEQSAESYLYSQESSSSPPTLPYIRGLWPLPSSSNQSSHVDANYDFPDSDTTFEQFGGAQVYTAQEVNNVDKSANPQRKLSAESLCQQYFLQSSHQLVIGRKGAGKTWLRLYLDRYITITEQESYPLFFLAPSTLLFQIDEKKILECLASSVANQLFANMLRQAALHDRNANLFLATRTGIAPFLSRHHYNLPSEIQSLSQPVPPATLLDIDRQYKDNPLYIEIRRMMAVGHESAVETTEDQILSDISTMMTIVGLQRLIILVDNWESVATQARVKMISRLLNESLLRKLSSHNIFFKLFVPTMKFEMPAHFYQNSLLTRYTDSGQYELSLFTYHEPSH